MDIYKRIGDMSVRYLLLRDMSEHLRISVISEPKFNVIRSEISTVGIYLFIVLVHCQIDEKLIHVLIYIPFI